MSKNYRYPIIMGTNTLLIMAIAIVIVCVLPFTMPISLADSIFAFENPSIIADEALNAANNNPELEEKLAIMENNSLLTTANLFLPEPELKNKIIVTITGYSSTVEETDDTPFITASNTTVRQGIVAANFLSFGTKIRIPDIYGDTIFVVEDRMNVRNKQNVDIWFPSRSEAKEFGVKKTYIEVLSN